MGSKPVRAAHMMKYGAPLQEVSTRPESENKISTASTDEVDGDTILSTASPSLHWQRASHSRPPSRQDQEASIARLMRKPVRGGSHNRAVSSPKAGVSQSDISVSGLTTTRKLMEERARAELSMHNLFPPYGEPSNGVDLERELPYPIDWRKTPVGSCSREGVVWLYESIVMDRQTDSTIVVSKAQTKIDRLLKDQGVLPVNTVLTTRQEVRDMVRSSKRFGILFDILATRRNVLTGAPHHTAQQIYDYVEEKYPIYVVHMFVGLTDNGTKRVARDIFNSNPPPPKHGLSTLAKSRLPFSAIDSEHLYVVHPNGVEAEEMRSKGEEFQRQREAEHRRRHCTPKYQPPASPDWLVGLEQRKHQVESRLARSRTPLSALRSGTASPGPSARSVSSGWERAGPAAKERGYPLRECDRCWLFCKGKPQAGAQDDIDSSIPTVVHQEDHTTGATPTLKGGGNTAAIHLPPKLVSVSSESPFTTNASTKAESKPRPSIDFGSLHLKSRQAKRRATKFRVNSVVDDTSEMHSGEPPTRLEELRRLAEAVGMRTVSGKEHSAKTITKMHARASSPAKV